MPPGFAYGLLVLSEVADFSYLCLEYHHHQREQGIAWDDPALGISWLASTENRNIQLYVKDQCRQPLKDQLNICLCSHKYTGLPCLSKPPRRSEAVSPKVFAFNHLKPSRMSPKSQAN